jgi:hypothetical protein
MNLKTEPLFPLPQIGYSRDDYFTPPWIFAKLGLRFDLDVCAPPGGVAWIPATRYVTQEDDALRVEWRGRVWMNPPFSNPTPFVRRFVQHGDGVALVPTSNGRWMGELWNADVTWASLDYLKFINGSTGQQMETTIPIRCWLVGAGETCAAALAAFGRTR